MGDQVRAQAMGQAEAETGRLVRAVSRRRLLRVGLGVALLAPALTLLDIRAAAAGSSSDDDGGGKNDPNNSGHEDERKKDDEKKREEEERQKRISELEKDLDRIRDRLASTTDVDTQESLELEAEHLQAELDELEGK